SSLPRLQTIPFDGRVLIFTIAVLVVCGLLMGLAPAWRLANADIRTLLNSSGRSATATRATSRLMSGLIVAEVALAIALVAGASWLVQSFTRLRAIDPGFKAEGRLIVDVRATRTFPQQVEAFAWAGEALNRARAAVGDTGTVGAALVYP